MDARNARHTIVGPQGGVRTVPRVSRWARPPWIGGFGPGGRLHELATERTGEGDGFVEMLQALDHDGAPEGTHLLPSVQPPRPTVGAGIVTSLPFEPLVLRAWDPSGGVWQALSSEYRIVRIDLEGDTTAIVAREHPALPFTTAERDSLDAGIRRAEQMGAPVESGMIPQARPPLRWFSVDEAGHLWVCASGRDPCRSVDVFEASGHFLGTVQLPGAVLDLPRPVIRNNRFHAAVEGPAGEPQLLVATVRRP